MTLYTTCGNERQAHAPEMAQRMHDLCGGIAYDTETEKLVPCPCEGHGKQEADR